MASQQALWLQTVQRASTLVKAARGYDADWPAGTLEAADFALDATLAGQPTPTPTPTPSPSFVAPLASGARYGQNKWLIDGPGYSLGADLFCKRGEPIVAPADCLVEEVIGGQGVSGGAEVIIATPDKSWAWRFRHVQASVQVGQRVPQGGLLARVGDTSLDMLCPQPVVGFPDGWQHLDLSVAQGTDRFAPTGGGGGNYRAYQWLQDIGYQGQAMARTPGPPSCGMGEAEAVQFLTPWARRTE